MSAEQLEGLKSGFREEVECTLHEEDDEGSIIA